MSNKILMVLTSHNELGNSGEKTGFWVEEFAAPYYQFVDAGFDVTIASVLGGLPPIDPKSELPDFQTAATQRFDKDTQVQNTMANSHALATINSSDFDGVFYCGGHGPLWDLTDSTTSIALIESFLAAQKPVAAVCHASAVLLNVKDAAGNYAIQNRAVTGFSNTEEEAVQLTDVVPFLLEDELVKRQATYQKGDDWSAFAIQDGLIITGQNPASSELTSRKLMDCIRAK